MKIFIIILIIFIPQVIFAQLEITEIMYDAEGADAGLEWIEVFNNGTSDVLVADWYFYENEINHRLIPESFDVLSPGQYALIVQDISKIKEIYRSIRLIKSSFSLSNEGEVLMINDPSKDTTFSVNYSTTNGAAGNGNTLQLIDGNWIEGAPTPAESNKTSVNIVSSVKKGDSSHSGTKSNKDKKKKNIANYYTGSIILPEQVLVESPVSIQTHIFHTKDIKTVKKLRGLFYLNLGDGNSFESDTWFNINHVYKYPGTYVAVLEYYSSTLSRDTQKEPLVVIKKDIVVTESSVFILSVDDKQGIVIKNDLNQDINLENWDISFGGIQYDFPKKSYIQANNTLTISRETHKLPYISFDSWVLLRNEKNFTIYSYTKNIKKLENIRKKNLETKPPKENLVSKENVFRIEKILNEPVSGTIDDKYLEQYPNKKTASFNSKYTGVYATNETPSSDFIKLFALGTGVVALAIGILRGVKKSKKENTDTLNTQDIELLE